MSRRRGQDRFTPPRRTLILTRDLDDDATASEKEGAIRRRLVAMTGRCPCGAVVELPAHLEPGTVTVVAVEHERGCPAIEELS